MTPPVSSFTAISLSFDDGSAIRKRTEAAFEQFHNVSKLGDEAAAASFTILTST